MSDKEELLDEIDVVLLAKRNLDVGYYVYILLTLTFIAMFAFPKVYISQQIYFQSRDIAKQKIAYETLKEENRIISASVESIKFKNQILDTLF
ncbi:hypothetical protein GJV85_08865 [Sulfurimonas aquatica]|uniref:Uncharacterized protein n=1 Tax=Sulfurimonas aquatica TaxID=2672570 RepID=A0A975GDC6_9BACT|nr:hypothetical protein [Sulfurimonas aquatica]QSZ42218.1 hypothetical protein GJV85_08865 [Sulfurimonas aquatica]